MKKEEYLAIIEKIKNEKAKILKKAKQKTSFIPFLILMLIAAIWVLISTSILTNNPDFTFNNIFIDGIISAITLIYVVLIYYYFLIWPFIIFFHVPKWKKRVLKENEELFKLTVFNYYHSNSKNIQFEIMKKVRSLNISSFSGLNELTSFQEPRKEMIAWVSEDKFCYALRSVRFFDTLESLTFEKMYKDFKSIPTHYDEWLNEALNSIGFINIENIMYWRVIGDKSEWVDVSGGGSKGGLSLGGALLGDLIAGPAGMILGGIKNMGAEEIKSTRMIDDKRKVAIYYSENGKNRDIYFSIEDENTIRLLFPHKEYGSHLLNQSAKDFNNDKSTKTSDGIELKINQLRNLLNKNIITKEEFEKKKAELIAAI
jgi:hypothetical protein